MTKPTNCYALAFYELGTDFNVLLHGVNAISSADELRSIDLPTLFYTRDGIKHSIRTSAAGGAVDLVIADDAGTTTGASIFALLLAGTEFDAALTVCDAAGRPVETHAFLGARIASICQPTLEAVPAGGQPREPVELVRGVQLAFTSYSVGFVS